MKSAILATVCKAGNRIARGRSLFSCNALSHAGLGSELIKTYWMDVYGGSQIEFDKLSVGARLVPKVFANPIDKVGWIAYLDGSAEVRAQRLIMLAFFHELVRSGDINAFTS